VNEAVRRTEYDWRSHDRLRYSGVADVHGERGAIRDPLRGRDHEFLAVTGESRVLIVYLDSLDGELLEVEVEAGEILRCGRRDLVQRIQLIGDRVVREAQVVVLDVVTPVALKREVGIANPARAGRLVALLGRGRRNADRQAGDSKAGGAKAKSLC
jgi:hypothetical protein